MPLLSRDELQEILDGAFPLSEVAHVESVVGDTVLISMVVDARHGRPGGTLSGPTTMMLADTGAWLVIMAHTGPLLLAVTTSLHIDFLRKPALTDLMARARLLKLGRQLAVADVELFSRDTSELVAKAQVTYSLPSQRSAERSYSAESPVTSDEL